MSEKMIWFVLATDMDWECCFLLKGTDGIKIYLHGMCDFFTAGSCFLLHLICFRRCRVYTRHCRKQISR